MAKFKRIIPLILLAGLLLLTGRALAQTYSFSLEFLQPGS